MTRAAIAALLLALMWTTASAQQGLRSASLPDRTPPPLASTSPDLFLAGPNTYTLRPPRRANRPLPYAGNYPYSEKRSAARRIDPNVIRIDRSDLDPIASAVPTPPRVMAAGPPKTFYVIPGCYAGDKPPQADRLRPGCSISQTRTVPPVLNVAR
jgi:hypothetical protein